RAFVDDGVAGNGRRSGRGWQQRGEHVHRGRLAGAVRTQEAVDLTRFDAQIDPVHGARTLLELAHQCVRFDAVVVRALHAPAGYRWANSFRSTAESAVKAMRVSARAGSRVVSRCRPRPGSSTTRASRGSRCTSSQSSIVRASASTLTTTGVKAVAGRGQNRPPKTATGSNSAAKFVPQRSEKREGRAAPCQ